jgi:anti-sigma factor ChrR (cupin superfamily)
MMMYATPLVEPASNLKDRLFARLELAPQNPPAMEIPSKIPEGFDGLVPFFAVKSQDMQWSAHPIPGVSISVFYRDEVRREVVGVLKADAGVDYPWHRHAAVEELYMLSGDLSIGDERYGAGDYIRSCPGSAHAPYTLGGCMFFFRTSIDDEYPERPEM